MPSTRRYNNPRSPAGSGSKDSDSDAERAPAKNYITPAGFRRLQREFETLRGPTRREVVAKLADAAAEGDRSENAEYIYRKRQLRQIDSRIRFLMKRMAIAEVIDASQHKGDRVTFGSIVTVEDESGKELRYHIVGVDESEPKEGRISYSSPIGKALIGKRVDDTVTLRVNAGERELVLLSIEFPSGEQGGEGGLSIADAMLQAQRALQDSGDPEGGDGDGDGDSDGERGGPDADRGRD